MSFVDFSIGIGIMFISVTISVAILLRIIVKLSAELKGSSMKYKLVSEETASRLEFRVNDLIKCGWTPTGSVSVNELNNYNNDNRFSQAMIFQEADHE